MEGDVNQYSLPIAGVEGISDTLGGIIVGSGLSITSGGVLSVDPLELTDLTDLLDSVYAPIVHTHVWADITNAPTSLSFFSNTTTNFQNATQVGVLISNAIGELVFVQDLFVSDGTDEFNNGDLVKVDETGAKTVLYNTIVETDIKVMTGAELDPGQDDPTIVQEGTYIVVNFGQPTMTWARINIPVYTGSTPSTGIQVVVSGQTISANLLTNSVARTQLTQGLRDELDSFMKLQNEANLGIGNAAGVDNIAIFNSAGQAVDSGKTIAEILEEVDLSVLEGKVDALETAMTTHAHTGADGSVKVDYNNLLNIPVYRMPAVVTGTTATVPLQLPAGSKGAVIEYVAQRGSDEEMGTLRYLVTSKELRQTDVFDNTDGAGVEAVFSVSTTAGAIDISNDGSGTLNVAFNVTVI